MNPAEQVQLRRTFAIISHPDAGKTTMTEKLLHLGNAISMAGTVKAKKTGRHATSDWMAMEKERGISVTTSVMQFPYRDRVVNLLDTPGHEDFSEDTYRTLTAVDAALMVIDGARGVEPRTIKLMEVCRMRATPIVTFVNKLDREIRDPIELLDEIETILDIQCAPVTWPIGAGQRFRGVYHLTTDTVHLYERGQEGTARTIAGLDSVEVTEELADQADELREEIELVRGASHEFDVSAYLRGEQTPVFFGSALSGFGVDLMLDGFVEHSPSPGARKTDQRAVDPEEARFSGFVFKVQANMDPRHRDRVAFLRVCSGRYRNGMKMRHVREGKDIRISDAVTFFAGDRSQVDEAWPGDIIGLHNHGLIQIGDSFTEGENLRFQGIPNFAPELFRRVRVRDPLRTKQLEKGLAQLSEEGATQMFSRLLGNDLIVGAVGVLQFDVVAWRLKEEYNADCIYEPLTLHTARWVFCDDERHLQDFRKRNMENLATDGGGFLAYLAPTRVNLDLAMERWPNIRFSATREH